MRALVTGAAGFIGSHVVRSLVDRGVDVHAMVRPTNPMKRLKGVEGRFSVEVADLSDAASVIGVIRRVSPDVTFHLAWYAEPGLYLNAVSENLQSLEASSTLIRSLMDQGSSRLELSVHTSSIYTDHLRMSAESYRR
jgi:nucleoside-diphosphate-sugar epimerase